MQEQFGTNPWPTSPAEPSGFSPSSLLATPAAEPSLRPQRTWPAVLTLYFLAPIIAEMLTGGTPPLMWNNIVRHHSANWTLWLRRHSGT